MNLPALKCGVSHDKRKMLGKIQRMQGLVGESAEAIPLFSKEKSILACMQ